MSSHTKNTPIVLSADREPFEAVFHRYYSLVYQLAFRYIAQRDEADDIAQEVFLRFYRTPPRATSDAEQRSWLCRVTVNLSLNALRSRQRRTHHEDRACLSEDTLQTNPEQQVLASEQADMIRAVLAEMPERQQTYLTLRSIGLSYAEIAQATGVAPASVGALLARAEREFWRRYHERTQSTTTE